MFDYGRQKKECRLSTGIDWGYLGVEDVFKEDREDSYRGVQTGSWNLIWDFNKGRVENVMNSKKLSLHGKESFHYTAKRQGFLQLSKEPVT